VLLTKFVGLAVPFPAHDRAGHKISNQALSK